MYREILVIFPRKSIDQSGARQMIHHLVSASAVLMDL